MNTGNYGMLLNSPTEYLTQFQLTCISDEDGVLQYVEVRYNCVKRTHIFYQVVRLIYRYTLVSKDKAVFKSYKLL